MSDEVVLSSTSVSDWLSCGYKYLRRHVWREQGIGNVDAAVGTAVHSGAEHMIRGPLTPEKALSDSLESELASVPDLEPAAREKASTGATRMLDLYREKVISQFNATLVEWPFQFGIEGAIWTGVGDVADEATDEVRDLKTTQPGSSFKPANYRFQVTGQALGYESITGRKPKRVILDVLTPKPTYRMYEIEPDYAEFVDTVGLTRDGILEGKFDPTGPANGACRWCPFKLACEYARD